MIKRSKVIAGVLVLMLALAGWGQGVFAQGTTTIFLSGRNPHVGDSLTVKVQATESGTVTVKYSASVLQLLGCDVEGYQEENGAVTYTGDVANLQFQAIAEGTSSVIVSSDTLKGSSISISVGAGQPAAQPADDHAQNVDTQGQFTVDGEAYVVSERFTNSEILAGFERTEASVGEKTYQALSNGTDVLLYLKPASNTSGKGTFYLYRQSDGTVAPAVYFGTREDYVLVCPAEIPLDEAWVGTAVTVGEQAVMMYALEQEWPEFFYFYGVNEEGVYQWYQYDAAEGTVQRLNQELLAQRETEEEDSVSEPAEPAVKKNNLRYVVAVLIFIIVVLVIVLINVLTGNRRRGVWEEDDMIEEEEDEADAEDVRAVIPDAKAAVPDKKAAMSDAKMAVPDRKATMSDAKAVIPDAKATASDKKAVVPDVKVTAPDEKEAPHVPQGSAERARPSSESRNADRDAAEPSAHEKSGDIPEITIMDFNDL